MLGEVEEGHMLRLIFWKGQKQVKSQLFWPGLVSKQWGKISFKVALSSKFLFSYLILYVTQWTSVKEKCNLDKMQSFLEVRKTFKFAAILVHHSHQFSHGLEWVVTQIKEHVTSGFTYLASFTFVN